MNSHSLINARTMSVTFCALGLATGLAVHPLQADEWDKKTILSVSQPIQVEETLLRPGEYVFKLLNSNSDRHIVQIFNSDQSHLINTVLAVPNYRLQPTGNTRFMFWETPPGTAKAMRAWFYPGDNFGQEFRYPKHLEMVEMAMARTPSPAPAVTEPEETPAPPPQPEATPQPETVTQQPEPERQPVEVAENTPPPAPAPQPQEAPAPQQPTTLPKTSSPYPLIGLTGLFSLGLFGLLRLKRSL